MSDLSPTLPLARPRPLARGADRLAWSNLAAQSAEQVALAAAPLVAVLMLGVGAVGTGLLQAILTLPFVLFAIPTGLAADRLPRRTVMAAAEALRAAALAALALLVAFDLLSLPLLASLGFLAVCATVAFSVAAPALVPALVPGTALAAANARIELARTLAFAAGPALGGALFGAAGAAAVFALAAALSATAAALLASLPEPAHPALPPRHPLADIREGIAFVLAHPLLRPIFVTQAIFNVAWFLMLATFVPFAVTRLGLSAGGVGLTLAMSGVGMVAGALAAPALMRQHSFAVVIPVGPLAGLAAAVLIAATAALPSPVLAGAGFLLLGLGPILWTISTTTLRQRVTPPALLARASAMNILTWGARPLGSGLGAGIAALWGAEACLYAAVAVFALQAGIILAAPAVALQRSSAAAA